MSWLNFNDSLNSIKGQLTNFANTVLTEEKLDDQKNAETFADSETVQENKNDGFATEDNWRWSTDESKTDQLKTDETITNLKKKISELENENRDLIASLDLLEQNHQENNGELLKMKNKLSEELETVTEKYEILNMRYNKLALAENGYKKRLNELKNKCDELAQQNGVQINDEQFENEKKILEEKIATLENTNKELETLLFETNAAMESKLSQITSNVERLETENKALKITVQTYKQGAAEKEEYENKIRNLEEQLRNANEKNDKKERIFLNILREHFAEYFEFPDNEDSPTQFANSIKNISNLLKNFESKCASMESKIFDLTLEKTDVQNKKNAEIEKLLQNSEMLTQELFEKSREIKDLEDECSELMKNNEILIAKIEENKQNGLQTIFEFNEENVDTLEKQLESANKKIEELSKNENSECESLRKIIENLEHELNATKNERDNCRVLIDKMRLDFETTEYQFSEMNVNLETLSEEVEKHKQKIDALILENNNLKSSKHESSKMNEFDGVKCLIEFAKGLEENLDKFDSKISHSMKEKEERIKKLKICSETMKKSEFEGINVKNEELSEILKKSQDELKGLTLEKNEIESKLGETQRELDETKDFNKEFQLSLKNAEQKLLEIETSRNELLQSLENAQRKLEDATLSKNELEKSLENAEIQLQDKNISLENAVQKLENLELSKNQLLESLEKTQKQLQEIIKSRDELKSSLELTQSKLENTEFTESFQTELQQITNSRDELLSTLEQTKKELQDIKSSRNELIAIVQTKHQETLTYHAEIQRLSEILKVETEKNIQLENQLESLKKSLISNETIDAKNQEIEKLNDQVNFLRENCNVLAQNMLDEQRNSEIEKIALIEKETTLNKNLERLQNHLVEIEEHYTLELLESEKKMNQLQSSLNDAEQREKDSSTIYTSVSIRANQQNEALQQQLQSMTNQRDELKKKFMELEDENSIKAAALSNLQLVLEQFQKDKEGDVLRETERIRRQLKHEQKIQEDLRAEIGNLEAQIKENKQGLQAALRLADQLEMSKSQINNLREEITVLVEKLSKKEEELKAIASQTDGKIDKSLIKNLIIGFVSSNNKLNKDQMQILKIIATVLDFNEQEHNKVNLNQSQQSNWLRTILNPISGDDAPTYESLSRAFVNFLESESKPRVIPSLLPQNSEESNANSVSSSNRTTPTPIVLNEIVLPTFSDFPQHRNSSSILKGVLKDNNT